MDDEEMKNAATEWNVPLNQELRLDVGPKETLLLTLVRGTAEIFGAELATGKKYKFSNCTFAVFTWHGCTLSVEGVARSESYVAGETPMSSYINTHAALLNLRKEATEKMTSGPRVMIVGAQCSGKSTLARILLNYAVRSEAVPMFVDLDVSHNHICMPGTVSACQVDQIVDVERGIDAKNPISYFFGNPEPTSNVELYKSLVERLSESVNRRMGEDPLCNQSGLILNTCRWIDGSGYDMLLQVAQLFKITVILVLGNDRLLNKLGNDESVDRVSCVKLERSGGVQEADAKARRAARMQRIKEYFRGPTGDLNPNQASGIPTDDFNVFKLGGGSRAPSSALPHGHDSIIDSQKPKKVAISHDMTHSILAVSHASNPDHILEQNVAGFVHLTKVDLRDGRSEVTVLMPSIAEPPTSTYILGSIKWFDK